MESRKGERERNRVYRLILILSGIEMTVVSFAFVLFLKLKSYPL